MDCLGGVVTAPRPRPRRRRLEGGALPHEVVDCEPRERDSPRPGSAGVSRGRLHLPPSGGFLKAVVRVRPLGEPRGRNRGGAFRMLAWISRRPRAVSETRTRICYSDGSIFPVSHAASAPAATAPSRGRRRRPWSGRPRRATSLHATSGEDPAGHPDGCCRTRGSQR